MVATPVVGIPPWAESAIAQEVVFADLEEADRLFQEGLELRQGEDYETAIERFQAALVIYEARGDRSNQADTLNQLGNIYLSLGEHDQALALYQQAIEIRQASNLTEDSPSPSPHDVSPLTTPQTQDIVFQSPDISMPGARIPGGSRGASPVDGLIALVPNSNYGQTISPHPSLFVYLPRAYERLAMTFMLFDEEDNLLNESTRAYPDTAGILEIDMESMDGLAPLEIGKQYGWYLLLEDEDTSDYLYGRIHRVKPLAASVQTELALNNGPHVYAEEGLWFDALADLFEQRIGMADSFNPEDLQALLAQEELEYLDTNHFIGSWTNLLEVVEATANETSSEDKAQVSSENTEVDLENTNNSEPNSYTPTIPAPPPRGDAINGTR